MACAFANANRLERLLRNEVTPDERSALLAHFGDPCEECLDLLAAHGGDEFLAALAAPHDMRPDEADRLFAAAIAPERRAPVWRRRSTWARLTAAAAAAAALLVAVREEKRVATVAPTKEAPVVVHPSSPGRVVLAKSRPKGAVELPPEAELIAFAAQPGPEPRLRGKVIDGDAIAPGDRLLFRVRLSAPGFVYLVGEGNAAASTLLWPSGTDAASRTAGEFELDAGGRAMAVDPAQLGTSVSFALLACTGAVDAQLAAQQSSDTGRVSCSVQRLRVQVRSER